MSIFHFKQFSVQNEKSAMKVNTDSVLLGAWAGIPDKAQTGLDIGAGTGVLSLMLAQRNSNLEIIGVEIEENAFKECETNFYNSPWGERLTAVHSSLQEFIPNAKFDFIISNPPYFVNDLKSESKRKNLARHTDSLSFNDLILFVENHLTKSGVFSLILPKAESEFFIKLIHKTELRLVRIAKIKPNKEKEVNRIMMSFDRINEQLTEETFCVYKKTGIYSERHSQLTCEFYLNK